jgi:hypothetical protein
MPLAIYTAFRSTAPCLSSLFLGGRECLWPTWRRFFSHALLIKRSTQRSAPRPKPLCASFYCEGYSILGTSTAFPYIFLAMSTKTNALHSPNTSHAARTTRPPPCRQKIEHIYAPVCPPRASHLRQNTHIKIRYTPPATLRLSLSNHLTQHSPPNRTAHVALRAWCALFHVCACLPQHAPRSCRSLLLSFLNSQT